MRDILNYLKQLQKVDLEMLEVIKNRDTFPARVHDLEQQLADQQKRFTSTQQNYDKAHLEKHEKESKLKEDEERLKKWERRLNESKNAREASALSREIDAHKRLNTELQEEVLRLMEKEEQEKKVLEDVRSVIQKLEGTLTTERALCAEKLGELNAQIGEFEVARQQYVQHVTKDWLARYEVIKRAKGGLAIVAVQKGSCTGCNMRLRPQLYNTILKFKSLETCPGCKRLLYCDEEGTTNGT